jgi:hypothetical protein
VVAGVDQNAGLRAGLARKVGGHAPVGDVGVIEGGLEGLVFDEQALVGREASWAARRASSSQPMRLRMLCVPG